MKHVKELVVYTIKPEFSDEVETIQNIVKECVSTFKGFVSIESYQSTSSETTLMDWLNWESIEDAQSAQKQFETLPKYGQLMSYLEDMKFADHFKN